MLQDMFQMMEEVKDQRLWGEYAFSRDILRNRIKNDEKEEMILQAVQCGCDFAEMILAEYEGDSIMEIIEKTSIRLIYNEEAVIGNRILFAECTSDEIVIMTEPLKKYDILIRQKNLEGILPSVEQVCALLLGHELYHWIEERYQDNIYTRKKKVVLWKIWKFENQSTIRALGELAAMSFTQRLNGVSFSPFILDVLLSYPYSKEMAYDIYRDIVNIIEKKKKEVSMK